MRVDPTPIHRRYAVVAAAMGLWAVATAPAWLADPLAPPARFGAPGAVHLLGLGVVGFVVLGRLYHIVPFVVWVHRYSGLLGYRDVPMIDDLYDDRLAADLVLLLTGTAPVVAWDGLALPATLGATRRGLVGVGVLVFVTNLLLVLRRHSADAVTELLFGVRDSTERDSTSPSPSPSRGPAFVTSTSHVSRPDCRYSHSSARSRSVW